MQGGQQGDGASMFVAFSLLRILDMFLDAQVAEILDQDQPFVQILRQYPGRGKALLRQMPGNGDEGARVFMRRRRIHQHRPARSAEHTSELKSLMRLSYAVFCV